MTDRCSPDSALRSKVISEIVEQTLLKDYDGAGKTFLSHHPKAPNALVLGPRHELKGNDVPGPGAYDITSKGTERAIRHYAGHAIIGQRSFPKDTARANIPGPGSYHSPAPPSKGESLKYSIGRTRREFRDHTNVPGPGEYTLPSQFSSRPHTVRTTFGAGAARPPVSGMRKDRVHVFHPFELESPRRVFVPPSWGLRHRTGYGPDGGERSTKTNT